MKKGNPMKGAKWTCVVGLFCLAAASWGQSFTLGLVSDGQPKENAAAAYEWAKSKFDAKVIGVPKSKNELTSYGVVWWDESNSASIPAPFLDKAVTDAFRGYVEAGGGLLLTSLAFHYIFEMGVEAEAPRYFGANAASPLDWTDFQISKGQEKHDIFKGLKVENGIIQYDIQGWTDGSDFYTAAGPNGPKKGTLLAEVVKGQPQTNPLAEYKVGSGTVIIVGWVWTAWVINKKLQDVHGPLYGNIVNYLATKSKFAAVEPRGKLAVIWSDLKQ
jgi:hypothetical protein